MRRSPKAKSRRRAMRGRGKVADWFKGAIRDVNSFLKRNKVLSSIGQALTDNVVPPQWKPLAQQGVNIAKRSGYGRCGMVGRGAKLDALKRMNATLRERKYISRGLAGALKYGLVPAQYTPAVQKAHDVSKLLGYGMRTGRGITLAGGALRLAGSRRY